MPNASQHLVQSLDRIIPFPSRLSRILPADSGLRPAGVAPRALRIPVLWLCLGAFAFLSSACGGPRGTPEDRVRALIAQAEESAEARRLADFSDYLSEDYRDEHGNTRREALGLLAANFLRNRSLHLMTRIREIRVTGPTEAEATVLVAMAGSPLAGPEQLLSLRADVYRFHLRLREEHGALRVHSAVWQPALAGEMSQP